MLVFFITTSLGFALTAFLPAIVQTVFRRGPEAYEVLLVCSGAGAIAGALIVAALQKVKEHGHVVLLTLIGLGASTCAFALNNGSRLPAS